MGVHRSGFDPINIVDNVTQPGDSSTQDSITGSMVSDAATETTAIDITIDEEDHKKVFGSQSSVPLELPPRPPVASQDANQASIPPLSGPWGAPPSPPPDYDVSLQNSQNAAISDRTKSTPVGTYHLLLPTALHESGLLFNPQMSLSDVIVEQDPQANADASSQSTTASSETAASAPSLSDIEACKPHPDALFVAESLEWRVVLDQSEIYRNPPPDLAVMDFDHLFDACNLPTKSVSMFETVPTSIPPHEQRNPIQLLERWTPDASASTIPVLDEFNMHKCWITGKRILSSPPDSIVSVIDRSLLMRFKENRENDPALGLTGAETFIRALRVLMRIIGNFVHGERRPAPTSSMAMTQKLGWDQDTRRLFRDLGWKEQTTADGRNAIMPPLTAQSSAQDAAAGEASNESAQDPLASKIVLQRHVRAWIELSVWLAFHVQLLRNSNPASSLLTSPDPAFATRIVVESASESVVQMIGEGPHHLDTSYSKNLSATTLEALFNLGATSTTRDELVKLGYLVNLEATPKRATELFACLDEVYNSQRRTSRILEEIIAYERSQGKYAPRDLDKAYERLHLSPAHLGPDVARESIPIDFIVDNYKARAREVLINNDAAEHAAVKDALIIITAHLGRPERLVQVLEEEVDMDVDQAYKLLDANPELDDATILVVFDLYVLDAPARRDILRHALRAVAEDRKSDYLRHYLRTGEKEESATEGWQQMPSADVPAGIDNIGNTCYLNSVLQYFFSITEIRNRVLQAAATVQAGAGEAEAENEEGWTERRVGGQRITARELQRSRRFVAQLGELFHHLIHANALSVRPERELAYLALVSSRTEELEAEANPLPESAAGDELMQGQDAGANATISTEPAPIEEETEQPSASAQVQSTGVDGDSMDTTADDTAASVVAAPASGSAPPLPPRPARKSTGIEAAIPPPARRNSLMQLGAQQDVSECLDNCMFQLEVALAISKEAKAQHNMEVDGTEEQAGAREDLLTSLFLGKTCQRIEADTLPNGSVSHHNENSTDGTLTRPSAHKQPSTHIKHEVFKILPIDVLEEGRDIYDGFDGFFDSDTFLATSGTVQRRSVTLLSAPPLLQIQLQRVQYDRATMRAFKSQAHLEMPEALYMDRYMDGDGPERVGRRLNYQAKRRRIEELRAKIAACKDGAGGNLTQTLSQAADLMGELGRLPSLADVVCQLADITAEGGKEDGAETVPLSPRARAQAAAELPDDGDAGTEPIANGDAVPSTPPTLTPSDMPHPLFSLIDPGLPTLLRDESKLLRSQINAAQEEIASLKAEMASIWAEEKRFAYRLVAVFMHRGEASHGHYFLNMRGGAEEGKWFKYNDSAVTPTSLGEVLRDRSGATPYLVTYVREDWVGLVDPICRQLEVETQQQDVGEVGGMGEVVRGVAGWEGGEGEKEKPTVVTTEIQPSAAGDNTESPIKRARTDDL